MSRSAAAATEDGADGRLLRTVATRARILAAARALLLEGIDEPVARQIAERAGVTPRTLFRHFSDMDALFGALVREAEATALEVMNEPFTGDSDDPATGLELIIDRRVRVYESLLPLYVSRIWQRHEGVQTRKERATTGARRRRRLLEILPEHIRQDASRFAAMDAVLGIEYWSSLRRSQQLDVDQARDALRCAVRALAGAETR